MRSLFGSIATLLMMLVIGCTWVDPAECWPNTSGGFGGGGTIPIGAGVGATGSGDYITEPPRGPLDDSGTPNPCMASESLPQSTCQGEKPAADGAAFVSCTDACRSRGMDFTLPQGIFCKQFAGNVTAAFKSKYPGLGAEATNP